MISNISIIGWFHTIVSLAAMIIALYALLRYKIFNFCNISSKTYLLLTFLAGASALFIYNNGGFNIAHLLALATIIFVLAGLYIEIKKLFGRWSIYFYTSAYTSTLLFHLVPGLTEVLQRFPADSPKVVGFEPVLFEYYKILFLIYAFILIVQLIWIRVYKLDV